MQISYSLSTLASIFKEANISGKTTLTITGIATLNSAQKGQLSFLGNKKYKKEVPSCQASVILLPLDYVGDPKENQVFIRVENPSLALATLCKEIHAELWPKPESIIHPTAIIHRSAVVHPSCSVGEKVIIEAGTKIGRNCSISAGAHIGRNVIIGEDCTLMPKVCVLDYCELGNRITIQAGAIIGADGFGYEMVNGAYQKVPQIGNVVLEDDVEVGANTTIDRARFGSTRIGKGTKIDNLVQIGHNCDIGKHCIIVAQTGISGSTVLEDYVVLGGQVGVAGHVTLGKGTQVGAQSGINCNLEPKSYVRGTPAYSFVQAQKVEILTRRLPDLFKQVSQLESKVSDLSYKTAD